MPLYIGNEKVSIAHSTAPSISSLNITPTTSAQTIVAPSGTDGYNPINVSAVTSNIDNNIIAGNIKSGVSILGVTGSLIELKGETRTVSLTSSSGNTFTPSSNKNGITSIHVTPTNQNRTVTPTTSTQTLNVNSGYSGNGTITVNAVTSSIDSNITAGNIKKDITILGVTGTYEGSGGGVISNINDNYLIKTNGDIELLTNGTFTLGAKDTNIPNYTFRITYEGNSTIERVSLNSLTTISGISAMESTFDNCTNLTSVNLSNLITISGTYAMTLTFSGCNFSSIDLSSLTTISGRDGMRYTFERCKNLISVDLSSLTTISGEGGMRYTFEGCSSLTSISFPSLTTVNGSDAISGTFYGCTNLISISFPALTSTSFGSYDNQFNYMLDHVNGCTVHFPSNLQSVIGSWSDVTSGFGGTNTTVLFDLPATT